MLHGLKKPNITSGSSSRRETPDEITLRMWGTNPRQSRLAPFGDAQSWFFPSTTGSDHPSGPVSRIRFGRGALGPVRMRVRATVWSLTGLLAAATVWLLLSTPAEEDRAGWVINRAATGHPAAARAELASTTAGCTLLEEPWLIDGTSLDQRGTARSHAAAPFRAAVSKVSSPPPEAEATPPSEEVAAAEPPGTAAIPARDTPAALDANPY